MLLTEHSETFSSITRSYHLRNFTLFSFYALLFGGGESKKISGFPAGFESDRINAEIEI